MDLWLSVPSDCFVNVQTVSGDVTAENLANVQFETSSGQIEASSVKVCRAETSSGDVSCGRVSSELQVRTASGDIVVQESQLKKARVESSSGDIEVSTGFVDTGDYLVRNVSGDVEIAVAGNHGVDVDFTTTSGEVEVNIPVELVVTDPRHWKGRINGGGPSVRVETVSGDLSLSTGAEVDRSQVDMGKVTAGATGSPPGRSEGTGQSDEETMRVLRALESGEVTLDDAMKRLDSIGSS